MQPRGFDSFEAKLGDEMRGERATLGKSFEDVGRDLRLDAQIIKAIEDCDHTLFPNRNVVSGYVRSYARYLRLDPDRCFRLFCEESGFRFSSVGSPAASRTEPRTGDFPNSVVDGDFAASPLADFPGAARPASFPVPAGTVFTFLALLLTMTGVGYAGYSVLQNIQRVGFAPAVAAPEVIAQTPESPLLADGGAPYGNGAAYESGAAYEAQYEPAPADYGKGGPRAPTVLNAQPRPGRDGPISEIDPVSYGAFAAIERIPEDQAAAGASDDEPAAPEPVFAGIAVHAVQDVWVQIIDESNIILFQGILRPGQSYVLPDSVTSPNIHVGNAGGVYIRIDDAVYGPTGKPGQVIKRLPLMAEIIRAKFPEVDELEIGNSVAKPEDRHATATFQ